MVSCCPDRKMVTVRDLVAAYDNATPAQPDTGEPDPYVERMSAEADAKLVGTGFMVDGRRVCPSRIKIIGTSEEQPDTGDVAALREGWVTIPDNTGDMILNGMVGALDCLDEIASAEWSGDDAVGRIQAFARREHDYALAALSKPNDPGREG